MCTQKTAGRVPNARRDQQWRTWKMYLSYCKWSYSGVSQTVERMATLTINNGPYVCQIFASQIRKQLEEWQSCGMLTLSEEWVAFCYNLTRRYLVLRDLCGAFRVAEDGQIPAPAL